jgi:hypothetical protein
LFHAKFAQTLGYTIIEDVFLLPNITKETKIFAQKFYLRGKAKKAIQSIKKIRGSQNDDQNASPESWHASRI